MSAEFLYTQKNTAPAIAITAGSFLQRGFSAQNLTWEHARLFLPRKRMDEWDVVERYVVKNVPSKNLLIIRRKKKLERRKPFFDLIPARVASLR